MVWKIIIDKDLTNEAQWGELQNVKNAVPELGGGVGVVVLDSYSGKEGVGPILDFPENATVRYQAKYKGYFAQNTKGQIALELVFLRDGSPVTVKHGSRTSTGRVVVNIEYYTGETITPDKWVFILKKQGEKKAYLTDATFTQILDTIEFPDVQPNQIRIGVYAYQSDTQGKIANALFYVKGAYTNMMVEMEYMMFQMKNMMFWIFMVVIVSVFLKALFGKHKKSKTSKQATEKTGEGGKK